MGKIKTRKLRKAISIAVFSLIAFHAAPTSGASEDGWRTWDDMLSGRYAVVYGSPANIFECFRGRFRVSLQVRNQQGEWKDMQVVTTKKSRRCNGSFAALFRGPVTELGREIGGVLYLEMRMSSPASNGWKAYRSRPALVPQYKSRADQIRSLDRALREALLGL